MANSTLSQRALDHSIQANNNNMMLSISSTMLAKERDTDKELEENIFARSSSFTPSYSFVKILNRLIKHIPLLLRANPLDRCQFSGDD